MKKAISFAMAAVMAISFAACGGSKPAASSAAPAASSEAAAPAITSLDDLAGCKIGVQQGTTGDIYATDDFGDEAVERYNKGADAVNALITGKIQAVIIDNGPASEFVAANADKLTMLDTPYAEEDYAICLAKNSEMTAQFNEAIAEIKTNGTLDAILDKYINDVEGAEGYVTPEGTDHSKGVLTMATNAYFPPYEFYDDGGSDVVGIDAEFARAICDYLGYELKIEDMEFDSIISAVNSGKADFGAAGMTVTEDRLKNVDFTESYCTGVQSVIVLK